MALSDAAVLIPGTGRIYLAPVGTAEPTDPDTVPIAPWGDVGHTSRDNGVTITREGGDSEVKGTWQNPSLRERRNPVTWALTFQLHQVDANSLRLYFGGGVATTGKFVVPANPVPQEHALYVVMIDGPARVGLHFPKVSIAATDDISVDVEEFLTFPVRATVLSASGSNLLEWFADSIVAPAGGTLSTSGD